MRELTAEDNPLGPEVIARAVCDSLGQGDSVQRVRLMVAAALARHLPERVKTVYQHVNRFLVDKGVLPALRIGVRKRSTDKPQTPGAEDEGLTAQPRPDLLSLLQRLLDSGHTGLSGPAPYLRATPLGVQAGVAGPPRTEPRAALRLPPPARAALWCCRT
ncbi:MAG: DUF1631 family protein [Burkholderiales bacterium]|nr:DUF1631 family protein [Burkholderiales bacterium]